MQKYTKFQLMPYKLDHGNVLEEFSQDESMSSTYGEYILVTNFKRVYLLLFMLAESFFLHD
jgi:hypothetical protein